MSNKPPWHARFALAMTDLAVAGISALMAIWAWASIVELLFAVWRETRSQKATPTPEREAVAESAPAESEPLAPAPDRRRWRGGSR